ncbi:MAG: ATP-binding protein [Chloroflexota bacterium]|nr:ATP-binding protein [Chloroflexota bacterium]
MFGRFNAGLCSSNVEVRSGQVTMQDSEVPVLSRDAIQRLLGAPGETTSVDYKLRLDWSAKQLEVVRDLACFANRAGGSLLIGVREEKGRSTAAVGMADDDPLPDLNEIGNLFRKYFERTLPISVVPHEVNGKRIGVISINAFGNEPIVAARNGGDCNRLVIRRGAIYRRSDGGSCEEAGPAEVAQLLEACTERRIAQVKSLVASIPPAALPASQPRVIPQHVQRLEDASLGKFATLRAVDLHPARAPSPQLRTRELEQLLEQSSVRTAATTYFPRYLSSASGEGRVVVRAPGRLVVKGEGTTFGSAAPFVSLIEMRADGAVYVRESLWEDTRFDEGQRMLGILSMIRFALAALAFAYRMFSAIAANRFTLRVGLLGPEGRSLVRDWEDAWPFFERYAASTGDDLLLSRDLSLEEVDTKEKRADVAFALIEEFLDFFGYVLERKDFDQLVTRTGTHGDIRPLGSIRTGTASAKP